MSDIRTETSTSGSSPPTPRWTRWTSWFLLAALLTVLFAPGLSGRAVLGFRDAGHYYYPLFQWQCAEWAAGRVPLWNPYESLGVSSLAQTTPSVLYPGKLIFVLPLSFSVRYAIYTTFHVLLALATAAWTARRLGTSGEAALLCGVIYACSGCVLFQCHNVVFLVGAAWLPLALERSAKLAVGGGWRTALGLGMVLAMMTLGGDPQTAYHAGLLGVLGALLIPATGAPGAAYRKRFVLLLLAAVCGTALAAVQIWPGIEAGRNSLRAEHDRPRNVYELAAAVLFRSEPVRQDRDPEKERRKAPGWLHEAQALIAPPIRGTHHADALKYSVAPWHLAEMLWPHCFGDPAPVNQRWISAVPADARAWSPSLYCGLLPLLLAARAAVRRGTPLGRWLTCSMVLFVAGSFGWYGVGWLVHELAVATGAAPTQRPWVGPSVGGLHWMMTVLLPGFVTFRYPAKLFTVALLPAALLAAFELDRVTRSPPAWLARSLAAVAALSAAVWLTFQFSKTTWSAWVGEAAAADPTFGPVDVPSAAAALQSSFLHAIVVALVTWAVTQLWPSRKSLAAALLCVSILDVGIAQRSLLITIPAQAARLLPTDSPIPSLLQSEIAPWRTDRRNVRLPAEWLQTSDPRRMEQVVQWERKTALPLHNLTTRTAIVDPGRTLRSADVAAVLRLSAELGHATTIYDALSVRYALHTDSSADSRSIVEHDSVQPRAWLVSDVSSLPVLERPSRISRSIRTRRVLLDESGQPRDLSRRAIVEADEVPRFPPQPLTGHTCRITSWSPQRVEVSVRTPVPCLLVLNDLFDPGWQAWAATDNKTPRPGTIYRTNRVMRGVFLAAGSHRVTFRYTGGHLRYAAIVSVVAWCLACIVGRRSRREDTTKSQRVEVGVGRRVQGKGLQRVSHSDLIVCGSVKFRG